ncbi:uncharacterized protein N7500_001455 [Penicillium coprophilum]|uniref:uncharacterized protein n=1 Tax=Penicillium coprophilum TaxID=36646 RepID=UPI0023A71C3C|nr:uncharacterized protein N7500_001455 [Penicillium coprophilum]KAJ5173524.1 hypothetical protein N7500_001455 [Penicillium coprophilum]
MEYRRLQHSYPPRPSPLGASQEPRDPRQFAVPFTESHQLETDKPRPYPSSSSNATPSPSPLYQSATSRTNTSRGDTSSAYLPRNGSTQAHRRYGSLETRNHEQTHRRNNSQPQVRYREGLLGASVMNHTPPQPETTRRTSQGSSRSPGFPASNEQSAPAFGNRQMPPPSPPHSYSSRAQPTHAPGGSLMSRDIPNGQAHRPGSSMSISAMLGSDPDRPAREPARESAPFFSRPPASSIFGNAPSSSSSAAMSPPTATARPSPLDNSFFRRSHTPEKPFSKPQGARTYRSGSGGGSSLLGGEQSVFGGLTRSSLSQYPEKPHSTHPSPRMSTAEPPYNEPRRMSLSGPIARPSSQPPHADAPTRPPGYSPISQPGGVADRTFESGPRPASGSYGTHDPQHGRFSNMFGERRSEDTAQRERERAPTHGSDAKLTQSGSYRYGSHYGERDPLDRHQSGSTWDHGRSHPPSPESKRFPAPEHGSGFGFGAIQSYTKSLGSQPGGNRQSQISLQSRNSQPTPPPSHDPYLRHQGQPPRIGSTPTISASTAAASSGLAALADEGRRKGSEELLHHRSLLAVGAGGKRGGRASPLPQAVQGAQAPYIGPAGEPAIKNELGRVFSGIGSGVGGVTAATGGSGPSTPLGSSPFKRDSLTGRSNGEGMDETSKLARPSSAAGRRSRKSRDEEQMDLEANDARGILSARNARRSRHSHHHHHHHHHHRHKADEEAATLSSLQRPTFFHRTSPADPSAPHHHHQHHHHHHHHVSRPAAIPAASPIREPRTTVNLEPLLSSVAHLPRHHLGSTLYTPRISTPTAKSSLDSSKFGYTTTPQPLPRFEQRENCTFTVRVPRFRIDQSHREEICARRALWGTGVYTDDSDPVAAAIHSGFIRGAWGEDVDESMLDLEIKDTYHHAPPPEATADGSPTKGPRLPPVPPPDRDLHITLLVLPRVAQYDSALLFGLKSRKWDGHHDGMSFKVHAVDWVDEGVARGEERSGEARRKRLRTLMQTGRICTGPAMAKLDELRRSGVQVPRAIDSQDQAAPVQPVS